MKSLTALRSSHAYLCIVVCAAIFTDTFLYGVIVPILPHSLTRRAHVPPEQIQSLTAQLLAAYGAGVFPTSIFVGYAIDQISSRRLIVFIGLAIIGAATLLLELGTTIPFFYIGRVFQGAAAAVVWSASLAWLLERVGHDEFPEQMGYAVISQSVALAISPPVGGFLFDVLGYDAVFIICLAIVFLVVVMVILVPFDKPKEQSDQEAATAAYSSKDGVEESIRSISSATTIASIVPASETTPLVPQIEAPVTSEGTWYSTIYLLTSPQIMLNLSQLAFVTFLWSAFAAILPLRMKLLFDADAFGSGSVTLPLVVPTFLASFTLKASNKFGGKWVAAFLLALRIPATACLSIVDGTRPIDMVIFFVLLTILGLALNPIIPLLTSSLLRTITTLATDNPDIFGTRGAAGRGFGFSSCAFALGAMVGPLVSAALMEQVGWSALCLILAAINAVGFIAWMLVSDDSRKKRDSLARSSTAPH